MRITRDLLLNTAKDTVKRLTFGGHDLVCVYLTGSLIYDSTLCDCVDDNQHAEALDPAASEFQAHRGQCICSLNNNYVPRNEFLLRFRIEDHIRLLLTDTDVTGGLMGVRF